MFGRRGGRGGSWLGIEDLLAIWAETNLDSSSCCEAEGLRSYLQVDGEHQQGGGLPVAEHDALHGVLPTLLPHQGPRPDGQGYEDKHQDGQPADAQAVLCDGPLRLSWLLRKPLTETKVSPASSD